MPIDDLPLEYPQQGTCAFGGSETSVRRLHRHSAIEQELGEP
jgi:hypothetical protein